MYAIVDIETTGGYPVDNDITELAIVLHDGQKVVQRFESLLKPAVPIPYYIQVLTGITPALVEEAANFDEMAANIYELLRDKVFVAHNVNFDYSFLKHRLSLSGYDLNSPKLCTVRLARKVFPGLTSYSLGSLCRHFGINNMNRHRAGGDADATVQLLEHMLRNDAVPHITEFIKRGSREQFLPPNLPKEEIDKLPYTPGVYYFHNQKGKVLYVGKAKNIKWRVKSHFTHNGAGKQRQNFLRNIYTVSYQACGTELMAYILENIEIRRLWPEFNSSLKRFDAVFGLYDYVDQNGYLRLVVDKKRKNVQPLYSFNLQVEGLRLMNKLIEQFQLCPKLCFIQTDNETCTGIISKTCNGACEQLESTIVYNKKVEDAINFLQKNLPTFAVLDKRKDGSGHSCILMEKGRFYGMGDLGEDISVQTIEELKTHLTRYPETDYIRGLIYSYTEKNPDKKLIIPYG